MKSRRLLHAVPLVLILLSSVIEVKSQGFMGGFKGHHRGHGAVEFLLATGILAKLLNHRHKYGNHGRSILHALIGGPRYHGPRYPHARIPLDMPMSHHALLQDELLDTNALGSMSMPLMDNDLMLNQESALLASRSPMFMGQSMPLFAEGQLLAEAQLGQQLLAARRARKLLEARKLLAASEAKNLLAAQSEAVQMLAAEEAAHNSAFLAADQSRQFASSIAPPKHFTPRPMNQGPVYQGNTGQQQQQLNGQQSMNNNYLGQQHSQQMQGPINNYGGAQHQQIQGSGNNFGGPQLQQQMQGSMNNYGGSQVQQQMQTAASNNFVASQPLPMQGSLNSFMGSQSPPQMQSSASNFMPSYVPHQMGRSSARADEIIHLPPGLNEDEAAQVMANLHRMV